MYLHQPKQRQGGAYSFLPRSVSTLMATLPYDVGGALPKENKAFGGKMFVVPVVLPDNADKTLKATVLKQTVSSVRDGGGHGNWALKTQFLQSRLNIETIGETVKSKLQNFDNYASMVWVYESIHVLDLQGNTVNIPPNLTVPFRCNARYIKTQITCRSSHAFPACDILPSQESQIAMAAYSSSSWQYHDSYCDSPNASATRTIGDSYEYYGPHFFLCELGHSWHYRQCFIHEMEEGIV